MAPQTRGARTPQLAQILSTCAARCCNGPSVAPARKEATRPCGHRDHESAMDGSRRPGHNVRRFPLQRDNAAWPATDRVTVSLAVDATNTIPGSSFSPTPATLAGSALGGRARIASGRAAYRQLRRTRRKDQGRLNKKSALFGSSRPA
ncbi:hypothetical protein GQ53DRAFT_417303 [Thozetella sp. PMI_491]|nr:hypothetical protein GQ53DRAFT_417303 [Thozetella sp. PMI_491]